MRIPDELGLRRGWIYEVILTVSGNASPVGILTTDFESIEMDIYKTSTVCKDILEDGRYVINFVDDIGIFYNSVFEKQMLEFEGNHLKDADAFIELDLRKTRDMGNRIRINAIPTGFRVIKTPVLVNRARYLSLESLIARTKIPHVSGEEREFLERKIRENLRVGRRVAPGSEFERILEKL